MQAISRLSQTLAYFDDMPMGRPTSRPRTPFGERLAAAREEAGLSQKELAEKLHVSQRAICWWEREPVALRVDQLTTLANTLDVSVDFLLGRENGKKRAGGPVGKAKRLFEAISKLPRNQQEKVFTLLEPFVERYGNGHKQAA